MVLQGRLDQKENKELEEIKEIMEHKELKVMGGLLDL